MYMKRSTSKNKWRTPEPEKKVISRVCDNAVSPVVGVMLMLVVTIVVAAIIVAFTTGIGTSNEAAPTAKFDFKLHASGGIGSGTTWSQPGVECMIPIADGSFSSNDLMIVTTYVVPDKYNGAPLAHAGKSIVTKTTGRVQDYGIDIGTFKTTATLPASPDTNYWRDVDDPFEEHTYLCKCHIIPTAGNGLTVGPEQNQAKFFGGNLPIGSGTLWWFKDINAFLGFDIKQRTVYGFSEGSVVHIDVIHLPTNSVISSQDVKAIW